MRLIGLTLRRLFYLVVCMLGAPPCGHTTEGTQISRRGWTLGVWTGSEGHGDAPDRTTDTEGEAEGLDLLTNASGNTPALMIDESDRREERPWSTANEVSPLRPWRKTRAICARNTPRASRNHLSPVGRRKERRRGTPHVTCHITYTTRATKMVASFLVVILPRTLYGQGGMLNQSSMKLPVNSGNHVHRQIKDTSSNHIIRTQSNPIRPDEHLDQLPLYASP